MDESGLLLFTSDFVLYAFIFVVGIIVIKYINPFRHVVKRYAIPGLKPSDPALGNLVEVSLAGSFHQFLTNLHRQYGDVASFYLGRRLVVSTTSVLPRDGRQGLPFLLLEPFLLEKGLAPPRQAGRQRTHRAASGSAPDQQQQYRTWSQLAEKLAERLAAEPEDQQVALGARMRELATEGFLVTPLGRLFLTHADPLHFLQNLHTCWGELERHLNGSVPSEGSNRCNKFRKVKSAIFTAIEEIIQLVKQTPVAEIDGSWLGDNIHSEQPDDTVLAHVLLFIYGTFMPTQSLLTWCLYDLAAHPDQQDKVRSELRAELDSRLLDTVDELQRLCITRHTLRETARFHCVVPFTAAMLEADAELRPYKIPARTLVVQASQNQLLSRNQHDRFDPERFNEERLKKFPSDSTEMPGLEIAYDEATVYLSVLLRKFRFRLVAEQKVTPIYGHLAYPADEVFVTVEKI